MVGIPPTRRMLPARFALGGWLRGTVTAVLVLGVVGPTSAREPSPAPPYQVGLALGGHSYSSASGLGRYANDGPDNAPPLFAPLLATRLSRRLWGPWSIEGEVGLIPTRTRDGDATLWIRTGGLRAVRTFAARRGLIPFAVGGISVAGARSSDPVVVENDVDGSLHIGGGVLKRLGSEIFLRLEARLYWSPALGLVRGAAREDVAVPPEPEILVGISVPFGRESRRVAADADGDRLLDEDDLCPHAPGPYEAAGCPDLDSDGDAMVDRLDACPAQSEDVNGFQDTDGCPDELPAAVKTFTGVIEGIFFAQDSAVIEPESFAILNRAAEVLRQHPSLTVEISGHSDSTGTREHNLDLSAARAEAVKRYLIGSGIEASRLLSIGLGPDRPVTSNDTEAGRARNRRIEFRLVHSR